MDADSWQCGLEQSRHYGVPMDQPGNSGGDENNGWLKLGT